MSLIHEMCFEWLTRLWFTVDVTYQICMVEPWCGCSAEMAVIVSHTRGTRAFEVRLPGRLAVLVIYAGGGASVIRRGGSWQRPRRPETRWPGTPRPSRYRSRPSPRRGPILLADQRLCVRRADAAPRAAAASGAERAGTRRAVC